MYAEVLTAIGPGRAQYLALLTGGAVYFVEGLALSAVSLSSAAVACDGEAGEDSAGVAFLGSERNVERKLTTLNRLFDDCPAILDFRGRTDRLRMIFGEASYS